MHAELAVVGGVVAGDAVDEYMEYRKDGETLYFKYTLMTDERPDFENDTYIVESVDFEIDEDSIECLNGAGCDAEHDFDVSKVVIGTFRFSD